MAQVEPFAALRPKPELAARICELPYDVLSSAEAREQAKDNPLSFFHVSKPEIDLPENTDQYSPQVYAKGKENFDKLIREGSLKQDSQPYYYFYRQIMGKHAQIGLVAGASCEDYLKNIVKKHEFTRPDKEDDRVRHIETLNSQTGPVFLVYKAVAAVDAIAAKVTSQTPDADFTAKDGVRHTAWAVRDAATIEAIRKEFAKMPALYIADGHHRSAAAGRVYKSRNGAGHSAFFLSVIFPDNQVSIQAYNRVLKDFNGTDAAGLMKKLEKVFTFGSQSTAQPTKKHDLSLYVNGKWHALTFKPELTKIAKGIDGLDVSLLQNHVLAPIFGIDDPRTSKKINFVGGIRGTGELEKLVNSGEYACAFSMFPTSITDLMTIADQDGIMPPKSTWFEPKLRDAMFCHMI
ncbi:MAG: hypothetical protein JWO95_1862 [Verrucomicrobiales bacterium]|nr:hypothetical protein [Verrucomicrobiales bacterium]